MVLARAVANYVLLVASVFAATARAQTSPTPTPTPLDVNDISILWPVPQTKADVDALISLNDEAADGKIMSEELLGKLMDEAKGVSVGDTQISLPDEDQFRKPVTWKVAGIRVNPSALGSNPLALMQGGVIPSVRLIVQPVTVTGDKVEVHDFTAHVVFTQTLPRPDKTKPFQPNNDAFNALISDFRELKAFLQQAGVTTTGQALNVHPGFRFNGKSNEVPGFTDKIRSILKKHLSSSRLAVISFMGIPGHFEPWIFFKVTVDNGNLAREPVSGHFDPSQKQPMAQLLRNVGDMSAEPAPVPDATAVRQGFGVGTSLLFPSTVASHLDDSILPAAMDPATKQLKLRHVADFIANPFLRNTANTDCVSCHTETTRRKNIGGLTAPEGIAFKQPAGISKVADAMLPKDTWNVRNFGWGFNFFAKKTFKPTITQRAANEAAESADLINKGMSALPVPQPVAQADSTSDRVSPH